jgi:hypothetical protein
MFEGIAERMEKEIKALAPASMNSDLHSELYYFIFN